MIDFEELLESPAFLILGGGALIAEILGWIISKRMGLGGFPVWQLLILMAGTLVAAAVISQRD